MSDHIERKIGLGYTAEGLRVVAILGLYPAEPGKTITLTDHREAPDVDGVAIGFDLFDPSKSRNTSAYWVSSGQVPPEDRVVVRRHVTDATGPDREFIEQVWLDYHLNDVQAACVHMTEAALTPSDEVFAEYKARKVEERGTLQAYSPAFYGDGDALQKWRLDNVVCPVTGYRWGRAWLAEVVPEPVLTRYRELVQG